MTPPQLLAWFFESRLKRPIPEDIDAFVRELGLEHRDDLYRILMRERIYSAHKINS